MKVLLSIMELPLVGLGNLFLSVNEVKNNVTEVREIDYQHSNCSKRYSQDDMNSLMDFSEISRDDFFLFGKIFPDII